VAEWTVAITELLGLGSFALTALYSIAVAGVHCQFKATTRSAYSRGAPAAGPGILLGLEFLIAADIILDRGY